MKVHRRGVGLREGGATLGGFKEDGPEPPAPEKAMPNLVLMELSDRQRRQDGITHGVMVENMDVAARQAGLRAGDVVTEVDGKRVHNAAEFRRLMTSVPMGKYAVLRV